MANSEGTATEESRAAQDKLREESHPTQIASSLALLAMTQRDVIASPFAPCHSDPEPVEGEESHKAQGRLRRGNLALDG